MATPKKKTIRSNYMENAQTHALDKEIILVKRSKTSNKS